MGRPIGAFLALAAVIGFAVSIATSAWWTGHPVINGRPITAKEVNVGPLGATGCNTGGDGSCEILEQSQVIMIAGYGELGALALATLLAFFVLVAAYNVSDARRGIAKVSVFATLLAAAGGGALLALGPGLSAVNVTVPIGWGAYVLAGAVGASLLSSMITRTLEQEPLRLKTSMTPLPVPPGYPQQQFPDAAARARMPLAEDPRTIPSKSPPPPEPHTKPNRDHVHAFGRLDSNDEALTRPARVEEGATRPAPPLHEQLTRPARSPHALPIDERTLLPDHEPRAPRNTDPPSSADRDGWSLDPRSAVADSRPPRHDESRPRTKTLPPPPPPARGSASTPPPPPRTTPSRSTPPPLPQRAATSTSPPDVSGTISNTAKLSDGSSAPRAFSSLVAPETPAPATRGNAFMAQAAGTPRPPPSPTSPPSQSNSDSDLAASASWESPTDHEPPRTGPPAVPTGRASPSPTGRLSPLPSGRPSPSPTGRLSQPPFGRASPTGRLSPPPTGRGSPTGEHPVPRPSPSPTGRVSPSGPYSTGRPSPSGEYSISRPSPSPSGEYPTGRPSPAPGARRISPTGSRPVASPTSPPRSSKPKVPMPAPRASNPTLSHAIPPMPDARMTMDGEVATAVEIDAEAKAAARQRRSTDARTGQRELLAGDVTETGVEIPSAPSSSTDPDLLDRPTELAPPLDFGGVTDPAIPPDFLADQADASTNVDPADSHPTIRSRDVHEAVVAADFNRTIEQMPKRPSPIPIDLPAHPKRMPVSTAPMSLPPPRDMEAETVHSSGPRPACPQCESPMAWVEEHLRFYCRQCRMYF